MRLFFILLVFANLAFFAWTHGYFGASNEDREPQRLTKQLKADKLRLVRDVKAPAMKKDDPACRLINGLTAADAETLKAAVAAIGGEAKILPVAEPTLYLVLIAELANKAVADKKAAELTRFGVTEQRSVALASGRYEIILGSFPTEPAAREFLQGLVKRGIKSARVDSREQPPLRARVETRAAAAALLQQLPQLIAPYAGATVGECAP
ncbi:MAG: SPOR domain-containing protein [Sulfuritalea sp.]|jgi:hypothetical protein|nr:SPOR domain-containing protein [Sulfuritalea sp.]